MRLSIVTTMNILPWAGSEELWFLAAKSLREQGCEVDAWYPAIRGEAGPLDTLREDGVKVGSFGPADRGMGRLKASVMARLNSRYRRLAYPYPALSELGDLTLVSQGAVRDGLTWLEALGRAGKRYAVLCQANLEAQWPADGLALRLRKAFAGAERVWFVSKENERLFRVQTGYEEENTALAWNPLQPGTPTDALSWPEEAEVLRVAVVGRIDPFAKGQDLVLEVMSRDEWRDRQVEVTIYGAGPWRETAEHIIAQRGLTKVKFGGFLKPEEIWAENHALLLPSRHEGKSLAMLEAMWLGRPVVATAVAGAVEEVIHEETGLLCAGPSVESWAAAMEELWQRRGDLQGMGDRAASRLRERMPVAPGATLAEELMDLAKG